MEVSDPGRDLKKVENFNKFSGVEEDTALILSRYIIERTDWGTTGWA
jgi:hypothetical protein